MHARLCGRAARRILALAGLLALTLATLPFGAAADHEGYQWEVYVGNLEDPRGLTFDPEGYLVIAQEGTGEGFTGRISKAIEMIDPATGRRSVLLKDLANGLPSHWYYESDLPFLRDPSGTSDVAFSADGTLHFVVGTFYPERWSPKFEALWRADGVGYNELQNAAPYTWIWPWIVENEPFAPYGLDLGCNPYAMILDEDGTAYVTDAGANVTLRITPEGEISTFSVLPVQYAPDDPNLPLDPVQTGIAWGPDGAVYFALMTGAPYVEGASKVFRAEDQNGDGDAMDEGETTVYVEGLTTVTAIEFDHDGNLLATEFRGELLQQPGNTGRLIRIVDGEVEVLVDGLTSPTGLAIAVDGDIFVTQEFAGQVLRVWEE